MVQAKLKSALLKGYHFDGESITLGSALHELNVYKDVHIEIPLKSLNRHGLIAGATGTGKTKTIQLLAESLSSHGVPTLLMDLKGDLSGLAEKGSKNQAILDRHEQIGLPFKPHQFPVELLTLSGNSGVKLRATLSEFGPILFANILGVNQTQSSVIAILFKFCDDQQLPLLDLKDFKKVLNFCLNEGKEDIKNEYGLISTASANAILRKIIELEQQGGNEFFGEPSFEVEDLLRKNSKKEGYISILRLTDLQDRPKLFSSFMLCLLAEVYGKFPEVGDLNKPKLVIFIDEAHLLFKRASKELLAEIENIVKLIRSKGVGIFFCTQNPADIPNAVLSQLGLKIQHALRAFTAKDRKAIKLVSENYPTSSFYKTDQLLTSLGIGEALVTALNENGRPTPLAATKLCAPSSRMGPLTRQEITELNQRSRLVANYNQTIDRESAYEILNDKIEQYSNEQSDQTVKKQSSSKKSRENLATQLSKNTLIRQVSRTLVREFARGVLGVLTGGKSTRR